MTPIEIHFPDFPEEIKVSDARRATNFFIEDLTKDGAIPAKYLHPKLKGSLQSGYAWRPRGGKLVLWDIRAKGWVAKNSKSVGTPRWVSIAGNEIMRMHEQVRNKIVYELKEFFVEGLRSINLPAEKLEFPVKIQMEIHTFPQYRNWDLDNLWIYNKCFQDALRQVGIIPDDSIRFVTGAAGPSLVPVTRESDRKLLFRISRETDLRVLSHLTYWSINQKFDRPLELDGIAYPFKFLNISFDGNHGKPGDIVIEGDTPVGYICWANDGKKNSKAVKTLVALDRIRHQCYQLNCMPVFTQEDYDRMSELIKSVFMDNGIPVKVV